MIDPFNSLKVLCWRDKIEEILDGKIPSPVAVEIDPSNTCTQSCEWCMFKEFRATHNISLPKNIMFSLIEDLVGMGTKAITFTGGGEPLTNPITPEAMRLAHSSGIQVGLVTNGDLLEKRDIRDAVVETCRYVRLSLDAGRDETHYKLKRPKYADQLTRNLTSIRLIADSGFKGDIGTGFLIHPKNYSELPIIIERLEDMGVSYLQVRPCLGVKLTYEMGNYCRDVVEGYRGKLNIYANFKRFDEVRFGMMFEKCRATPLLGIVGADAKMYLCCQFRGNRKYAVGDLTKASFKQQWGAKRHLRLLARINLAKCPPCRYSMFNQLIEKVFLKDKMHRNFL
ncbi:radical SAM protein [Candidatus Bathyarchaeota archaeon]|nr:radical SAM protein [Candidatus Bathyarchaeota archaeon]